MKYFKDIKSFEDLKKQFRKLAMKYHPDRPHGDSETMKTINNEYDILFPIWKDRENIYQMKLLNQIEVNSIQLMVGKVINTIEI